METISLFLWPFLRASGFGSYPELERQRQSELKADLGSGFLIQFVIIENSVGFCFIPVNLFTEKNHSDLLTDLSVALSADFSSSVHDV